MSMMPPRMPTEKAVTDKGSAPSSKVATLDVCQDPDRSTFDKTDIGLVYSPGLPDWVNGESTWADEKHLSKEYRKPEAERVEITSGKDIPENLCFKFRGTPPKTIKIAGLSGPLYVKSAGYVCGFTPAFEGLKFDVNVLFNGTGQAELTVINPQKGGLLAADLYLKSLQELEQALGSERLLCQLSKSPFETISFPRDVAERIFSRQTDRRWPVDSTPPDADIFPPSDPRAKRTQSLVSDGELPDFRRFINELNRKNTGQPLDGKSCN